MTKKNGRQDTKRKRRDSGRPVHGSNGKGRDTYGFVRKTDTKGRLKKKMKKFKKNC
jgi:hypothetical protein